MRSGTIKSFVSDRTDSGSIMHGNTVGIDTRSVVLVVVAVVERTVGRFGLERAIDQA
ncbi:hypothetical protein JCM9743_11080 [Natrinema sp. JCM 9743]